MNQKSTDTPSNAAQCTVEIINLLNRKYAAECIIRDTKKCLQGITQLSQDILSQTILCLVTSIPISDIYL